MAEYVTNAYGFRISVDKDGGGTLGKFYEGNWTVSVENGPEYLRDNETLTTGTPKSHAEVARIAAEFVWAEMAQDEPLPLPE